MDVLGISLHLRWVYLTATNGDTGQPQFAPKPMRVVKILGF